MEYPTNILCLFVSDCVSWFDTCIVHSSLFHLKFCGYVCVFFFSQNYIHISTHSTYTCTYPHLHKFANKFALFALVAFVIWRHFIWNYNLNDFWRIFFLMLVISCVHANKVICIHGLKWRAKQYYITHNPQATTFTKI